MAPMSTGQAMRTDCGRVRSAMLQHPHSNGDVSDPTSPLVTGESFIFSEFLILKINNASNR